MATALDPGKVTASQKIFIDKVVLPEGFRILNAPGKDDEFSIAEIDYQLELETYPAVSTKSQIIWESSDPSVAVVNPNGLMSFNGFGKTVITAKCPETDTEVKEGFAKKVEFVVNVPKGYYREVFDDQRRADKWTASENGGSPAKYHAATATTDAYNLYTPGVQNAQQKKYRVDAKRSGDTYLSRSYPILCFRVEDVADRGFSRALKLDTNGNTEGGVRVYGDLGGGNGTWTTKYSCTDGSAILVYNLNDRTFFTDGGESILLPENDVAVLYTFQFKYADIVKPDENSIEDISYKMYWFNTFKTEEEMTAYLKAWSDRSNVGWGDYVPGQQPEEEVPEEDVVVGLKVLNAPSQDAIFPISGSYEVEFEKTEGTGTLEWRSSDASVATVTSGKVRFLAPGSAVIAVSCPEAQNDCELEAGYERSAELQFTVPEGYYREEFGYKASADKWTAGSGGTKVYVAATETTEAYNLYKPGVQNEEQKKYRVDAYRSEVTYLTRDFPYVCIRVDDVNDKGFARAIKVDTSSDVFDDAGNKLWAELGRGDQAWTTKYKCSDGSALLIYNLDDREFKYGTSNENFEWSVMPEDVVAHFNLFGLKYADIVKPDENTIDDISYRMFWFNTFEDENQMKTYLDDWSSKTGISYNE